MKQKLRKTVAWLLILAMLFTMLPGVTVTALATESTPTLVTNENRGTFGLDASYVGYYALGDADDLFWFANHVNTVDRAANAVLTADIDLDNEPWTPIGATSENSNNFRGHFDGDGHTIKGLYVEGGRAGLGFFGEVRTGTVENFTIYGEVKVIGSHDYVGGVIGSACGLNSNKPDHNGATIRNITSYVNLTAGAHGISMVGGFIGYANHETLIENCAWYGTFDAGEYRVDSGAGGFIGRIYNTATVTIRNCAAYGTVKTAYQSGTHDNYETIYIGGFLSFSPSDAKTVLENNLWAGQIINNTNLTEANAHLSAYGTMNSAASKTNCYALEGTPYVTTNNENAGGITTVTAAQLASGEVAYKLGAAWGQDLGTDDYPVLGGETVYYGYDSCADDAAKVYTNVSERPSHSYTNGFCSACDSYEPAADSDSDGYYEISNAGQLYWFAQQVNGGKTTINGKLMENITINANVLDANGGLNSGSFRVWTPIGNSSNRYAGTFDGNGKTVSGLYYNNGAPGTANRNIGLFGVLNGAAVQDVSVSASYLYGYQDVGGIAGSVAGNSTITGCTNSATVGGADLTVGGIVGTAGAGNSSITDCTNTGSITGGNNNVGSIAGGFSSTGRIANCTNTGSVSGTGTSSQAVGGIVGHLGKGTVENCYNTGSVGDARYEWVGGIAGYVGVSGIVNNCYNIGAVSGSSSVGAVVGYNMNAVTTNCYYLANRETDSFDGTTYKTTAQFASGEVAYLLGDAFGQTIGEEDYPVLGGAKVYAVTCVGNPIYSNSDESYTEHTNVGGFCAVCGAKLCDHSGNENKHTDCTVDFVCSICGVVITEAAAAHTPGTDDGDCTTAVLCSVCGTAVVAAKEHAFDSDSKCTNDGCTAIGYMLWVGGEQFTSKKLTITDENGGTATYDPENNILTLDNYTYEGAGHTWNEPYGNGYFMQFSAATCYGGTAPIRLVLNGESTVVHTGTSEGVDSCGIYTNGSIEILDGSAEGIGSLTANGGTAVSFSLGADTFGGSITVTGGSLTGNGGTARDFSYGVSVGGYDSNLTVTSGTVTATGGTAEADSCGIFTYGLTMGEGIGILTPTGGRLVDGVIFDAEGNYATEVEIGAGYTITAAFDSVDEKNVGGTVSGTGFYKAGANVTLTITPDTGCELKSVTAVSNGSTVNGTLSGSTYTFPMPAGNVAVTVTLERLFTPYDLWVGGEQFTDKKLTVNGTTGTATYDLETNTLTLDGYTYEGAGHTWEEAGWDDTPIHYGAAIYYSGTEPLNLVLNGENTVTHTGSAEMSASYGLYAKGNVVVREGSAGGSLAVTGGTSGGESYGVYANGSITVSGSLTAIGDNCGVYSYGSITVSGSLHATGEHYGVYANSSITVSGSLHATSGTEEYSSYGVLAYDGLTMGMGIGILTPEGGYFDDNGWYAVVDADGNPATEVRIAKSAPKVTLTDGNLTVTNTSVEADEMVDMTIMVAGYTGGKMTGCHVIEDVTGVTEVDLTVTGDAIKVFFLNPDTYEPLFACAEP